MQVAGGRGSSIGLIGDTAIDCVLYVTWSQAYIDEGGVYCQTPFQNTEKIDINN